MVTKKPARCETRKQGIADARSTEQPGPYATVRHDRQGVNSTANTPMIAAAAFTCGTDLSLRAISFVPSIEAPPSWIPSVRTPSRPAQSPIVRRRPHLQGSRQRAAAGRISSTLRSPGSPREVIFVGDDSPDGTARVARRSPPRSARALSAPSAGAGWQAYRGILCRRQRRWSRSWTPISPARRDDPCRRCTPRSRWRRTGGRQPLRGGSWMGPLLR